MLSIDSLIDFCDIDIHTIINIIQKGDSPFDGDESFLYFLADSNIEIQKRFYEKGGVLGCAHYDDDVELDTFEIFSEYLTKWKPDPLTSRFTKERFSKLFFDLVIKGMILFPLVKKNDMV
ncbi:MAG: hypothetical protein FWH41_09475 [Treponema sp.]|nr:hypothetical protein [Treponema sp.]MCL2139740.1 hypothetical protein [Treponema sp.]